MRFRRLMGENDGGDFGANNFEKSNQFSVSQAAADLALKEGLAEMEREDGFIGSDGDSNSGGSARAYTDPSMLTDEEIADLEGDGRG